LKVGNTWENKVTPLTSVGHFEVMIGSGLGKKDFEKGEEATVMKADKGRTLETGEETGDWRL